METKRASTWTRNAAGNQRKGGIVGVSVVGACGKNANHARVQIDTQRWWEKKENVWTILVVVFDADQVVATR